MNKLTKRKTAPPATSYTMSIASSSLDNFPLVRTHTDGAVATASTSTSHSPYVSPTSPSRRPLPNPPLPRTETEQYWAARALTSETLLNSKEAHYRELKSALSSAEYRRQKEIELIHQRHHHRVGKVENILIGLIASLVLMLLGGLYATYSIHKNQKQSWRSSWMPASHFTIPILSPFTSVTENDSSMLGPRTFTFFVVVPLLLCASIGFLYISRRYPELFSRLFFPSASQS